ncbi:MAG: hypothetical protein ABIJ23_01360 [Candidatus Magasanikbacteria bacterium]
MTKKKTTSKVLSVKKKDVGSKVSLLNGSEAIHTQLQQWAHTGNEESLKKLENFIAKEENKDLRFYATLAYGEAQYFYYGPQNEKEEREFELARLIKKEDEYLWKLINESERLECKIGKQKIEEAVFKRLLKKQNEKMKTAWQHRYIGDVMGLERRLQKVKEDIEYQIAWLKEARAMITTKRYQNIPDDVFEHMHTDFGEGACWTDDMSCCGSNYCDCDDDCCDCDEEDCCCPHCGSDDAVEIDDEIYPVGNYEEFSIDDIPF